jgi:hypothetical protein
MDMADRIRNDDRKGNSDDHEVERKFLEDIDKYETNIANEKPPQVALRYIEPAVTSSDGATTGPYISENVYTNGEFSAKRRVGPDNTLFHVKLNDGKFYADIIEGNDGRDRVYQEQHGEEPFPGGSKVHMDVVDKVHTIDFDHIPEYGHHK